MKLYDYIYVDLDKIVSLYSQLTGGIVEVKETHNTNNYTSDNKRNYDFKIFKHYAGGTSEESEINKVIIKPHHSLLQELEDKLYENGFLMDLSKLPNNLTLKDDAIRNNLKSFLCVKCTGKIVIEDYERIKSIAQVFPDIVKLINKSAQESVKTTNEYQELINQITELENNRNKNNIRKAKDLRKNLENFIQKASLVETVPQWILDGLKTWIDAFLPNIISIRVYPFSSESDEHIFGNLNHTNFTIKDLQSFHFTYGSLPTEEFTIIGIITSIPKKGDENFDPLEEFRKEYLTEDESFENAFRGVFRGFDGMEELIRTIRYPRVLVYPLLVYRETYSNTNIN